MADARTEKQKVKEITDRLEEGLKELFESEKYKNYLSTMSKFHSYSANNIQLIAMQRPDATFIAGYKAWQKNFERHVNKGEKGIRILAPAPYKIKEEQEKIDPVTKEPMLDEDGLPIVEEVEINIPAFRVVTVFDYAQTNGKELPGLGMNELHGNVENYQDFMEALKRVSPVPISYKKMEEDRKGYFLDLNHPIDIKEGMSEAQTAKTGVHEVAHAKLHAKEIRQNTETAANKDRETMEVEAESIAYTVCQHFGIDTSDYSFGYIAGWSSGKDMPELKSSLDTIRKTSSELIKGIEAQLLEIEKEKAAEHGQPETDFLSDDMTRISEIQQESKGSAQNREVPEFTREAALSAEISEEKYRELLPEEVKALVKERFASQLKGSGIDDVSIYMDKFEALYEQGKMEHLMPTEEEKRVPIDVPPDERANPYTNMEMDETELAFRLADRYISIQEATDGYDYTIYDMDYRELDGGVYDNPDMTIRQALDEIVSDLKDPAHRSRLEGSIQADDELMPIDYDGLMEKAEQAEKKHLEERIKNEAPEAVQSKIIADFKAKTEELFNGIGGQTQEDIELDVYAYLQSKIDEYEIDIELVDVVVSGSRCRGLEKADSDLDVVVEYKGREKEDDLFNAFNEDGFMIGGVKVDINPITEGKTGTLAEYLPGVEAYLEGVRETREQEPRSIFSIRMNDEERFFENTSSLDANALCKAYGECELPFVEMGQYGKWIDAGEFTAIQQSDHLAFSVEFNGETDEISIFDGENFEYRGLRETVYPDQAEKDVKITLTVAECGEFHDLGEYHEGISTVEEAAAVFHKIPPERRNGIPSIGINVHTEGTESYEDAQMDIVSGNVIDLEMLEYYPEITENQKALEVISELISKFPNAKVMGSLDKWLPADMQRSEQEKDVDRAALLAAEIDQLSYDYDTYQYNDTVEDRGAQVANITEDIRSGNTEYLNDFLNAIVSDSIREGIADIFGKGAELDDSEGVQTARKAKELLDRLAEYKPLAKIEELEECNYNMIDNVLNNEKPKEEQERKSGRISVKEKLAEKKAVIERTMDKAGKQVSEKGTEKKSGREI